MIFFNLILDRRCMHRYLIYKRSESSIEIYFYFYFCRDITSEILSERPEGSFVVRQSTSRPDCFALSVRVPNGSIAHYLINAVQCTEQSFYRIQVIWKTSFLDLIFCKIKTNQFYLLKIGPKYVGSLLNSSKKYQNFCCIFINKI